MNIFVLDNDPRLAAQYHCDKHVVKMITESLQLMGSTHWFQHGITKKKEIQSLGEKSLDIWKNFPRFNAEGKISPYGIGFMNHPSAKWARETDENWSWLLDLTQGLLDQYRDRYKKVSNSQKILDWYKNNTPRPPKNKLTPFYQAMPEDLRTDDPVHSYRLYYAGWKEYFAKWKNETPHWWKKYLKITVKKDLLADRVRERVVEKTHTLLVK